MSARRANKTLSLSEAAQTVLDDVGNASHYVDAVVLQHAREWTDALATLTRHGWRTAEIAAACKALAGYGLSIERHEGQFLAEELQRPSRRDKSLSEAGITERRWQQCMAKLTTQSAAAWALAAIAREYWLGNDACRLALATCEV